MWHRHVTASRRAASALAGVVVLLTSVAAPVWADAPYCSLRDPGHQIYEMYPDATAYRSVVRDINTDTQVAVDRKIPFPLLQGELGQHTLYVPVAGGVPLGYIQIRSELTEWGLAEIVWALNLDREVIDFRFQRCRGSTCKAVVEKGLPGLLAGRGHSGLVALLDEQGEMQESQVASMSDDERRLASVIARSAIKVIAVIESGWPTTVSELASNQAAP